MGKVKITQVRSRVDSNKFQKRTLDALGLTKNYKSVEKELTPQIEGMIKKVNHLVKVEQL